MRFNPFKSEVNIRPPQPYQAGKKKKKNCLCFSDNLNAMLASPIRKKKGKLKKNAILSKWLLQVKLDTFQHEIKYYKKMKLNTSLIIKLYLNFFDQLYCGDASLEYMGQKL